MPVGLYGVARCLLLCHYVRHILIGKSSPLSEYQERSTLFRAKFFFGWIAPFQLQPCYTLTTRKYFTYYIKGNGAHVPKTERDVSGVDEAFKSGSQTFQSFNRKGVGAARRPPYPYIAELCVCPVLSRMAEEITGLLSFILRPRISYSNFLFASVSCYESFSDKALAPTIMQ